MPEPQDVFAFLLVSFFSKISKCLSMHCFPWQDVQQWHADNISYRRTNLYLLLQENDIGQDFALFYIAYAAYLELRGSFEKAESVFQSGLKR